MQTNTTTQKADAEPEIHVAQFNRFEVSMSDRAVEECSQSGRVDDAVEYWAPRARVTGTDEAVRDELREYGAWDDAELSDDEANLRRIVWIAAGNIRDERAVTA